MEKIGEIISANVRRLQAEAGLSNMKAAEMCEIPLPTYNDIFYGKTESPGAVAMVAIAKGYQVSVALLFGESAPAAAANGSVDLERLSKIADRLESAVARGVLEPQGDEMGELTALVKKSGSPALLKRLVEQATSFLESQSKRVQQKKKRA